MGSSPWWNHFVRFLRKKTIILGINRYERVEKYSVSLFMKTHGPLYLTTDFFLLPYRHPKSGSFVRPKKADFGISVIEALKEQYGLGGDGINKEDMYVMSGGNKKKPVEMVGADSIQEKQRYL